MIANRYGLLEDTTFNQLIGVEVNQSFKEYKTFSFAFNATLFGRYSTYGSDVFIQQGYIGIKYKKIKLYIGRRENTWGVHHADLSTGSLGISRNARPLPMVHITIDSFVNVPFTRGFVKFKGDYGHAWLEEERYIQKPYLHFKSMYLKSNVNLPVDFYVGMVHFAIWGGKHPGGDTIPQGGKNYLRIITGKPSANKNLRNEYFNALGDHLGIMEYGFTVKSKYFNLKVYNQMPYEDLSGLRKFIFNKDRLIGLNVKLNRTTRPIEFLYEYLYTLDQSGPGTPDPPRGYSRKDLSPNYGYPYGGRDDYYNNSLYRSGWTYMDRIIGNPLFMEEEYASKFLKHTNSFNQYIVNNRIKAHHLGIKASPFHYWNLRFLSTYSKNYGTYAGLNGGQKGWLSKEPGFEDYQYAFKKPLRQWYWLMEVDTFLNAQKNLSAGIALAFDIGEIYSAAGIMARFTWSYRGQEKKQALVSGGTP